MYFSRHPHSNNQPTQNITVNANELRIVWNILSEKRLVLGRFLAHAMVQVSDNTFNESADLEDWASANDQSTIHNDRSRRQRGGPFDNAIYAQCVHSLSADADELPAMQIGPIYVHHEAEVYKCSAPLWRLLRLHRLFGRARLLWLILSLTLKGHTRVCWLPSNFSIVRSKLVVICLLILYKSRVIM